MKILIVDDEVNILNTVGTALRRSGFDIVTASSYKEGLEFCTESIDVALIDVWLGDGDGVELLEKLKAKFPELMVVMISGHADIAIAVKAVKGGAYDFLEKPLSLDRIELALENIRQLINLKRQRDDLLTELETDRQIIGNSESIENIRKLIARIAPETSAVLISGESGTGKELVARSLHHLSPRANEPFVAVNCAALPNEMAEAELFGYEKGAFTGAVKTHPGHFRRADNGVIFLDEITESSSALQAKLLRVIEDKKVIGLGSKDEHDVDVRIIAASNKDIKVEVDKGDFRGDLYYRLNVLPIHIPPLRERAEDIDSLIEYFCRRYAEKAHKKVKQIAPEGIKFLKTLSYPGNIRELKNYVERLLILADSDPVGLKEIKRILPGLEQKSYKGGELKNAVAEFEKDYISDVIEKSEGNMSEAARRLGLERSYLYKKIKALGIDT